MPQPSSIQPIGSSFIELQSVDSTNNYARQLIHAACLPDRQGLALHGVAIFAHEQVAGKGQRGKVWATERGSNIVLSIIINPQPLQLVQQFHLNACLAVAVHDFFSNYAGEETKIKWPNDLYWQDRKAGGILIESIVRSQESKPGSWEWAIAGIGININQTSFSGDLFNPVSLKQITGKDFNPVELAKELCAVIELRYAELNEDGFENIYNTYLNYLYKINDRVKLKKGNIVFEALIKGVTPTGKLITQHSVEEEFDFGKVEWVIR